MLRKVHLADDLDVAGPLKRGAIVVESELVGSSLWVLVALGPGHR